MIKTIKQKNISRLNSINHTIPKNFRYSKILCYNHNFYFCEKELVYHYNVLNKKIDNNLSYEKQIILQCLFKNNFDSVVYYIKTLNYMFEINLSDKCIINIYFVDFSRFFVFKNVFDTYYKNYTPVKKVKESNYLLILAKFPVDKFLTAYIFNPLNSKVIFKKTTQDTKTSCCKIKKQFYLCYYKLILIFNEKGEIIKQVNINTNLLSSIVDCYTFNNKIIIIFNQTNKILVSDIIFSNYNFYELTGDFLSLNNELILTTEKVYFWFDQKQLIKQKSDLLCFIIWCLKQKKIKLSKFLILQILD